jgi:aminoglycoside phosphotransferase
MGPEVALEYINAAMSKHYRVEIQYSGGEDQGAFRVINDDNTRAVLKLSKNPGWLSQIERAKAATKHLSQVGYPAPKYLYIDATDSGTFWLENELPGDHADTPTLEQINSLIAVIELQKDQIISEVQGQDWSWYASSAVFRGESGLVRTLMQFSNETSALAAAIEGLVLGLDGLVLSQTDMVHGDLGISQVLFSGNSVSAVLDWDQAGYGDRTMDLVGLWFSLMHDPASRDAVYAHMLQVSNPNAIKVFASYTMLSKIAWHIHKAGGDVADAIAQTRTALGILHSMQ